MTSLSQPSSSDFSSHSGHFPLGFNSQCLAGQIQWFAPVEPVPAEDAAGKIPGAQESQINLSSCTQILSQKKDQSVCTGCSRTIWHVSHCLNFTTEDLQAICPGNRPEKRARSESTVPSSLQMAEVKSMFREVLPKQGQLSVEDVTTMVLCKPKLLPLKSLTLERLEKMQQTAQDTVRQQEMAEKDNRQITH